MEKIMTKLVYFWQYPLLIKPEFPKYFIGSSESPLQQSSQGNHTGSSLMRIPQHHRILIFKIIFDCDSRTFVGFTSFKLNHHWKPPLVCIISGYCNNIERFWQCITHFKQLPWFFSIDGLPIWTVMNSSLPFEFPFIPVTFKVYKHKTWTSRTYHYKVIKNNKNINNTPDCVKREWKLKKDQ